MKLNLEDIPRLSAERVARWKTNGIYYPDEPEPVGRLLYVARFHKAAGNIALVEDNGGFRIYWRTTELRERSYPKTGPRPSPKLNARAEIRADRVRALRKGRREAGLCPRCGKKPARGDRESCGECRL